MGSRDRLRRLRRPSALHCAGFALAQRAAPSGHPCPWICGRWPDGHRLARRRLGPWTNLMDSPWTGCACPPPDHRYCPPAPQPSPTYPPAPARPAALPSNQFFQFGFRKSRTTAAARSAQADPPRTSARSAGRLGEGEPRQWRGGTPQGCPGVSRDFGTKRMRRGRDSKPLKINDLRGGVAAPAMRWGSRTSYAVGLLDFSAIMPKNHATHYRTCA